MKPETLDCDRGARAGASAAVRLQGAGPRRGTPVVVSLSFSPLEPSSETLLGKKLNETTTKKRKTKK